MNELIDLLVKPNVVVVDSLPKARLMNRLLLVKIAILTVLVAGLLYLAGWTPWMLAAGILFVAGWTFRGYRRDVARQRQMFGDRPR